MNSTNKKILLGVLVGALIGALSVIVAPRLLVGRAEAQVVTSTWRCFVADRLPNVNDAMSWRGAANIAQGLNVVAQRVAEGTVVSTGYPIGGGPGTQWTPVICIKY